MVDKPIIKSPTNISHQVQTQPQAQPKIRWKGDEEFRHDLFKLNVANMKKNSSYIPYQPSLHEVEHSHFFHSHDMKGRNQKYCSAVGGHFHEVSINWMSCDDEGNPEVVIGPAQCFRQRRLRSGKMQQIVSKVSFLTSPDKDDDPDARVTEILDNHTHTSTYVRSEMISPRKVKERQQADKQNLQGMIGDSIQAALTRNRPSEKTPFSPKGDLDEGSVKIGGASMSESGE